MLLIVEPRMHVNESAFEKTAQTAQSCGLTLSSKPGVKISRAAVFSNQGN
jgi:hypothetical protein